MSIVSLTIFNKLAKKGLTSKESSGSVFYKETHMGKIKVTYERENKLPDWATPFILKAMHLEGTSLRALGKEFGVSHETIRLIIKKAK